MQEQAFSPPREEPPLCSWRRMVSPLTLTQTLLEPSSADASYYFPWHVTASGGRAGTGWNQGIFRYRCSFITDNSKKEDEKKKGFSFSLFFTSKWRPSLASLNRGMEHIFIGIIHWMPLRYILTILFPRTLQDEFCFPYFINQKKKERKKEKIEAEADLHTHRVRFEIGACLLPQGPLNPLWLCCAKLLQ